MSLGSFLRSVSIAGAVLSFATGSKMLHAKGLSLDDLRQVCARRPRAVDGLMKPEQLTGEISKLVEDIEKEAKPALDAESSENTKGAESPKSPESPGGFKSLGDCTTALGNINSYIEQLRGATKLYCSMRAHEGVVRAAIFPDRVAERSRKIDAALKAAEPKNLAACKKAIQSQYDEITKWNKDADKMCLVRKPDTADPYKCGRDSLERKVRDAASGFCNALESTGVFSPGDVTTIVDCLVDLRKETNGGRSLSAARNIPEAAAADRALGGTELQTAILQGVADFFVKRAEQELSLYTADVVGRRVCQGKVKPLLVRTCALMDPDAEGLALGATPAGIREAVKADLDALPELVAKLLGEQNATLGCGVGLGWQFARRLLEGAKAAELLSHPQPMLDSELLKPLCSEGDRKRVSELAGQIAVVIQRGGGELAPLVRSGKVRAAVSLAVDPGAPEEIIDGNGGLTDNGKVAEEILWRLRELDGAIATWEKDRTAANRTALVAAGVRTIEPVLLYLAPNNEKDIRSAVSFAIQITSQQYARALVTLGSFDFVAKMDNGTKRVLSLAGSLAQAESSDDVQAAMESAALPLGSWRRKDEERLGMTLTGLVGFFGASEHVLEKAADGTSVPSGYTFAPTLMVGADIHRGFGKMRLGAYVGILDLGALASIRLQEPKAEADAPEGTGPKGTPDVRFEQVLAPTLFPYVGYGPIDIGPAVGYVPSLRAEKTANEGTSALDVVRFGVIIGVDVSVLPLL